MRDYTLTQSEIDSFHKNGFLVLENLYSKEFTYKFMTSVRRHANKDYAAIINPDRYETLLEVDERPKSDITLGEIKETSELCQKVMSNPTIVKVLRILQKNDVVGLSSQFIFK